MGGARHFTTLGVLWLLAGLAGCMSLEQMAPAVERLVPVDADPSGSEALARGRKTYVTTCAKCHAVEPVARYSEDRWREILPEMGKEARLGASQLADLEAYVLTARSVAKGGRG